MSVNLDASGIGQLAIKLGLVGEDQVRECLLELDDPKGPAEEMIRALERKRYLSSFQGNKLRKGDLDGYFLGGYRLLYKIASGSFGRVYRGDDPRTGQVVAVKVLRNKWTMDKQKIDLFLREGKLGMTIRHPNIVSVLAVNQDSKTGQYFIVMEFVEGGNLRDLLQIRKKLGFEEALRYMEECAQGLAYSHQRGLTHRDIKPTNILIDASTGQAKLVDYGLAEISAGSAVYLQRQDDRDEDVAVDRTVDYAGLEKATSQKPGDVRSDIYFLGCVLFECVTGQALMPVTRDRVARMMARRYQEVEDTLRKTGPALGIPPPVMSLLGRMVAYEPSQRFQTPSELAEAIQACRAEVARDDTAGGRVVAGLRTMYVVESYVVESNEKMKDAFRKLTNKGFRVLLSNDPEQALKQYQHKPFHTLIVDAGSVGREAVAAFNRLLRESDLAGLDLTAVLLLSEKNTAWAADAIRHERGAVLFLPLNMKELLKKISELTPSENGSK
jgi:eukaryotic-like serine/threonine-protein kinase